MKKTTIGLSAALLLTTGLPALAQTSTYRSGTVAPGKTARIGVVTALKKDCTVGPAVDVKVLTAPKHGTLNIRKSKLKTPATFRCPNVETPVQGLFYQAKPCYIGTDEIKYEAQAPDGTTRQITVQINVTDKSSAAPKDEGAPEL
jgi:hypothetical protein